MIVCLLENKHARVADGICVLIWNMRANGAFSTSPDGKIRNVRNTTLANLILSSHRNPSKFPSSILPYRQCGWPMDVVSDGCTQFVTQPADVDTLHLSELAISAPSSFGLGPFGLHRHDDHHTSLLFRRIKLSYLRSPSAHSINHA